MIKNLLTVDVENWTESSLRLLSKREAVLAGKYCRVKDMQVERGVYRLLDLLEENHFKATFFVLGQTAQTHQELIRQIHNRGHEVASHSMTHAFLPGLSVVEFENELKESKKILEDLLGVPVLGFRAPYLTAYPGPGIFFHQLQAAGYCYDSSFKAGIHEAESHPGTKKLPFIGNPHRGLTKGKKIYEVPVTMVNHMLWKVPLGGMYLKLLSPVMVSRQIEKINKKNRPALLYFHPYEMDQFPIGWLHPSPSIKARFLLLPRNLRKDQHIKVLNHLFQYHSFTSIKEYLAL